MRIISDELFAQLVKVLEQDEKVSVFKKLLLAPTAEPAPTDSEKPKKDSEVEK